MLNKDMLLGSRCWNNYKAPSSRLAKKSWRIKTSLSIYITIYYQKWHICFGGIDGPCVSLATRHLKFVWDLSCLDLNSIRFLVQSLSSPPSSKDYRLRVHHYIGLSSLPPTLSSWHATVFPGQEVEETHYIEGPGFNLGLWLGWEIVWSLQRLAIWALCV